MSSPTPSLPAAIRRQSVQEQTDLGKTENDQPQEPGLPPSAFVALVGDIHGDGSALKIAAAMPGVVAIVQVGDFGIPEPRMPRLGVPVYWIEGNHERWCDIGPMADGYVSLEFSPGCYYVPRATVLRLGGYRLLCGGGADSVDKAYQDALGFWSDREQWSRDDERAMCSHTDIDAIVTHSPPHSIIAAHFDPNDLTRYFGLPKTWTSPTAEAIDRVWTHYGRPPLYCGHMHRSVTDGTARILNINEIVLLPAKHPERAAALAVDRSWSTPEKALTPIGTPPEDTTRDA